MNFDLHEIFHQLTKEFGEGSITYASALKPREYRSSGSISVDMALGGGFGKSTVVDIVGKQSSGKTLLFEMAAVTAQREESRPSCLFDFEGTFDPTRFVALGGDLSGLALIRAENFGAKVGSLFLEWAADMMKQQLEHKMFACIGNDSTAAMTSKAEYAIKEEKGEEAATMAYTARGMSSVLRQVVGTGLLARSGTTLFYMSQMRDAIGVRGFKGMPPADKRTGGRALPFYAATQIEISRGETFKADLDENGLVSKDIEIGHETKIRVRKNKNNKNQGRVASFDLYSDGEIHGIDKVGELQRLSVLAGVVKKEGNYYTVFDSEERLHGKDALYQRLMLADAYDDVLYRTRQALDLEQVSTALPAETLGGAYDPDDQMMTKYADG